MPLNRPALTLGPGPRGVHEARRWVTQVCRDIERLDLVDCAELGVSELVTNAVLHGADPIQVRVRGTREHPRVEVRDASVERPVLPGPLALEPDDSLLLTFGRGLSIVARSSDAWGAEIESDGKIVWFAPARGFSEEGVEPVFSLATPDAMLPESPPPDMVDVMVPQVPLRLYVGFQHHFRELRREVRLLSLAAGEDYPVATSLAHLFETLESQLNDGMRLTQMQGALAAGAEVSDMSVRMPRAAADTLERLLDLLDLADEFCRAERLLSLARTAEQRDFQRWFLGQYIRQARGQATSEWTTASPEDGAVASGA